MRVGNRRLPTRLARVVGRCQRGVERAPPRPPVELEVEVVVVHVQDHVHVAPDGEGEDARRGVVEAGPAEQAAVPRDVGHPVVVGRTVVEGRGAQRGVAPAEVEQEPPEAHEARVPVDERPVEPRGLVVLVVGVVVPALRAARLVAGEEHRHAARDEQHDREVADLPLAQRLDLRVVGLALDAAVPAQVVVRAVPVALAVRLVVLPVVGDEVVEREAVVAGDEAHARRRRAALCLVQVGAAADARRGRADEAGVTAHEPAHVVAEPAVPFRPPAAREGADLVGASRVPCLRDQLRLAELVGELGELDERRRPHDAAVRRPRQHRRLVEAEAVDVQLVDPVAEAVEDELRHDRVVGVERVAAAREIEQHVRSPGLVHVVRLVREPSQADRGAAGAALAGVVVDDVQDHLEPRSVQRLD